MLIQPRLLVPGLLPRRRIASAPSPTFYRGINLNGLAETIAGNSWEASSGAANFSQNGYNATYLGTILPSEPDAATTRMLRTNHWNENWSCTFTSVPSGNYDVYIWNCEDDYEESFDFTLNGVVKATLTSGTQGAYKRQGPYQVTVSSGSLVVLCTGTYITYCGIELWNS